MTGALAQVRALVGLRWRMARSRAIRVGLAFIPLSFLVLFAGAVVAGRVVPDRLALHPALLAPTAYGGFAILAVVAPLAAGGGTELFPPDQLVGYPVRPSTQFLASLVTAPLNLAWLSQVALLAGLTSGAVPSAGGLPAALITLLLYVALVTVAGQAMAWTVVGVRQSPRGRMLLWVLGAALALAVILLVRARLGLRLLDHLPTVRVEVSALAGASGRYAVWADGLLLLAAGTVGALWLGVQATAWALRRPGTGIRRGDRQVARRPASRSPLWALIAADRASVWRTASLRRGALVLAILPAIAAGGLGVSWDSLVFLPGLVAAGTGLLFGVNVFCLDSSGAIWLASLPHPPTVAALAKAYVVVETCLLCVLAVVAAATLRSRAAPTAAELAALATAIVCSVLWVTSTCLKLSVTRPHRADLRGPRDTPAPPGSMIAYSARLALGSTLLGAVLVVAATGSRWAMPLAIGLPVSLLALRSLAASIRRYATPHVRAHVVATVAGG